ncbi:MAG: SCO family protein [Planctomycetota bacterium]
MQRSPDWRTTRHLTLSASRRSAVALCGLILFCLLAAPASARYNQQVQDTVPGQDQANPWLDELNNDVGITQKLGDALPTALPFIDEQGETVTLDQFLQTGRPIILNLGYNRCPSVCGLVLGHLVQNVGETGLDLGGDYLILNVSIDPGETPEHSRERRDEVKQMMAEAGAAFDPEGWRFLTAEPATIQSLTQTTGYGYIYLPAQNEFGHPAALVLLTGDGQISRYLTGTTYDGKTLRLSLVEASEGKVGNLLDAAFLTCFRWDSEANNYTATAKFIMMTGGVVTIVAITGGVFMLFAYERRRQQLLVQTDEPDPSPQTDA